MTGTQDQVSMFTLVLSSAVVSAAVNVGWNAVSKAIDYFKEKSKDDQKVGHVYLGIATQLEAFARHCSARIYDINEGLSLYRGQHNDNAFEGFGPVLLQFSPEPDWTALPVHFAADVQALPSRFQQSDLWIRSQFQYWAEIDDAYEFEQERLAYYALKACDVAARIRLKIKAPDSELIDLTERFHTFIAQRRAVYQENPATHNFLPELQAQFERDQSRPSRAR